MSEKKLVFIVDDDPFILNLVQKRLDGDEMSVVAFSYGEECLEQLSRNPELIVLDYIFYKKDEEVMGGMEIFNRIKEYNEDIPVIMLSGQDKGDVVLELARKGIEDYVIKDESLIDNLMIAVEGIFPKND
ncbi:MAG: response regulator [Bacteroidales bacterium]|nr:response regulator [Bacteroidales bacterium]